MTTRQHVNIHGHAVHISDLGECSSGLPWTENYYDQTKKVATCTPGWVFIGSPFYPSLESQQRVGDTFYMRACNPLTGNMIITVGVEQQISS